jgi:RNA polymerase sigma-70 factor (ECF subfamily)
MSDAVADAFRQDWGRVVAALIAAVGDWDLAEECAQEAFTVALTAWPRDGVPDNPRAWLITTARRRAVDRIRRARVGAVKEQAAVAVPFAAELDLDLEALDSGIDDELLRLIFTCCHPALALEARVTLALRTLCGLSVAEIARVFLVPEPTMAKRLVRTKRKIAVAGIPYRVPPARLLPERTAAVLAVVYLMFNEGYVASSGPDLMRPELCERALRLARDLAALMPDDPEAGGLQALLELHQARRAARVDASGVLVPLEEQDRSLWDRPAIAAGVAVLQRALRRGQPGPYQLQALIAACHATSSSAASTDWARIVSLYERLLVVMPSSSVRLNHAIAVAMRDGPEAGLGLLAGAGDHPLVPATRADLLRRLGRDATEDYRAALTQTTNGSERRYLERRLREARTVRR